MTDATDRELRPIENEQEDAIDVRTARKRLAEIDSGASRLVSGEELEERFARWTRTD